MHSQVKLTGKNARQGKNQHLWAEKEHFRFQIDRVPYAYEILKVFLIVSFSILYFHS